MEKKLQPKSAADARRPDTCNSKPWLRPKKRESPVNVPTKAENRKQNAPRGKSFDKRPRPRSSYHAVGGKEDSRLDEGGAEVGSVFLPGSKKQNLNHLLNFHYAPRDASRQGSNRGNRKPHGLIYTNSHKHNKELFLQSNCQFVVKSDGDYTPYLFDPDIPICWDFIEQINVRVNEPLSCPICLGETVAGRITRCGHTYCWPCLLRYFSLAEESSRPCPICFQPIDKNNLKSVQGVWHNYVPVGEDITMNLMRRLRGSTLVELAPSLDLENISGRSNDLLSVSENQPSSIFAKLLTASPREVIDIIMRERAELNSQLSEDLEYPEFVLEALHLLQKREDSLAAKDTSDKIKSDPISTPKSTEIEDNACDSSDIFVFEDNVSKRSTSESDNISKRSMSESDNNENFDSAQSNPSANFDNSTEKPNLTEKYFYFYQAADGQAIFLHGLDIRIIEASWGSLDLAPREIRGVILERASGSVGDECRRRLRCLQHLSIHCPYDFVEINLKPPFVTYDALKNYKVELDDRKRMRQKRARDEKRRERVISQKEQVLMGRIPKLEININSEEHFPAYQPGLELSPPSTDWKWNDTASIESSSPGPSSLGKNENSVSFAKMASAEGIWKVRQSYASPSTSAVTHDQDSDEDNLAPPDYHISLSEAITAALQKTSLNTHEESPNKDGKKKKKHKAKVLFTTGIQHRTAID